ETRSVRELESRRGGRRELYHVMVADEQTSDEVGETRIVLDEEQVHQPRVLRPGRSGPEIRAPARRARPRCSSPFSKVSESAIDDRLTRTADNEDGRADRPGLVALHRHGTARDGGRCLAEHAMNSDLAAGASIGA